MESKELIVVKSKNRYHIMVFLTCLFFLGLVIAFVGMENTNQSNISPLEEDSLQWTDTLEVVENHVEEEPKVEENLVTSEEEEQMIHESGNISQRQLNSQMPMVALTFDDGPDPNRTPKILEILNKNGAKATFFDIGFLMKDYPETVKAELEAGCDVGGHTYSHVNLNKLTQKEIEAEISKVDDIYRKIAGKELQYIRSPYGNANDLVKQTVKHPFIHWCVDSLDWKLRDKEKILKEIYKTENFDGKIIIMHAIYDTTIEAIEELIPELIDRGYQLVTITEMAKYKGYMLENGKIYYHF